MSATSAVVKRIGTLSQRQSPSGTLNLIVNSALGRTRCKDLGLNEVYPSPEYPCETNISTLPNGMRVVSRIFDPSRDKRIAGSTELTHAPRKKFNCLVLGNEKHIMEAKDLGLDFKSLDDLKKVNRDKKIVKKMGKSYDKILASSSIIRQIPRLLGPQLNRMEKFPLAVRPNEKSVSPTFILSLLYSKYQDAFSGNIC